MRQIDDIKEEIVRYHQMAFGSEDEDYRHNLQNDLTLSCIFEGRANILESKRK